MAKNNALNVSLITPCNQVNVTMNIVASMMVKNALLAKLDMSSDKEDVQDATVD